MAKASSRKDRILAVREKLLKQGYRFDVQVGSIVEICSLHIGTVLNVDYYSGNMEVHSLLKPDRIESCDLYHCGIVLQTSEEIAMKKAIFEKEGIKGLEKLYFGDKN